MPYNWTLSELKPEDWDFRGEKLRDEDLWDCFVYEYQREDTALRNAVEKSRKNHPDFARKFAAKVDRTLWEGLTQPIPPIAYDFHPEWPKVPFRRLRRQTKPPANAPNTFPPPAAFYGVIHRPISDLQKIFSDKEAPEKWAWTKISTLFSHTDLSDLALFEIPWHLPDDTLIKGFTEWLKDHRPKGDPRDSRPRVTPTPKPSGRGSRKTQLLASLKALGAYRLLLAYKGNRFNAQDHTDAIKGLGKNFENDAAWTRANTLAKQEIERVVKWGKNKIDRDKLAGKTLQAL